MRIQREGSELSRTFGKTVFAFESIDSTNTFARGLDESKAPHGTIVVAERQTKGKGRLGRVWDSPAGENLLFTLLLRPACEPERLSLLPIMSAVGVAEGIERATGLRAETKWPNDLVFKDKKLCGILLEGSIDLNRTSAVALGIGLNVNQTQFPDELKETATSLHLATGTPWIKDLILKFLLESLEDWYEKLSANSSSAIVDAWKQRSSMLGKRIQITEPGSSYEATAIDVDPQGALIVDPGGNQRKALYAGDVSIRIRKGALEPETD
jgi:BirA family biotin operon repressor/biotin-[acetyl-CoA-carboxylase] ligase